MKPKLSTLVLVGVVAAYSLSMLPLKRVAAQDDRRGMRVQQASLTEHRVALVIGNSAYKDSPLINPVNDSRAMAQALRGLGFEVIYGENLSQNDIKRNIRAFGEKIRNGGVGLFYYAGHGIQIKGTNYLIPVGAAISAEEEVEYESVDVGFVLAQMETARNRLNIVILDACRNNPFARSFRSAQKGLASIDAPAGTLIAYATAPGSVASDGSNGNGLYTQQLLKVMRMPELNIEQVFKQVRAAVRSQTDGKQIPWESSSLEGDFYFSVPAAVANTTSKPPASAAVELSFWESIKASSDVDDFKEYLAQYPAGRFAGLARNKIRNLEAAAKPGGTQPVSSGAAKQEHVDPQTYTETVNRVGIEMVRLPAGKFMMGSPASEAGRYDNEGPQHEVSVSSLYMGKYEVTQAQWRAVASLPKVKIDLNPDPSTFKGDNLPVETVSWDDAIEYCERLSRATGKTYRLPTEAEWEYAARARTTGPYAGDLDEMGWDGNNAGRTRLDADEIGRTDQNNYLKRLMDNGNQTHAVGQKKANGFGLYDMHGNVWEWCMDWYLENYYSQSLSVDPTGPSTGSARVHRGGSWLNLAQYLRSAVRGRGAPDFRGNGLGFRLVRALN